MPRHREHAELPVCDPTRLREAIAVLWDIPGVVGVLWGCPRRKGRWNRSRAVLAVRVVEKLERPEFPVPVEIFGLRTDVIAVGLPKAASLGAGNWAGAWPDPKKSGAVTAVIRTKSGVRALLSGHASLPSRNGQIVPRLDDPAAAFAGDGATDYAGHCIAGELTAETDWVLADFAAGEESLAHPATPNSETAPYPIVAPNRSSRVQHWSTVRQRLVRGEVFGFQGALRAVLPGGRMHDYDGVIEIVGKDRVFAEQGDSGSLVFLDNSANAVGVIVAVSTQSPFHAWALPAARFRDRMRGGTDFFA